MAGDDRTAPDHIAFLQQLATNPGSVGFFEAVRWLDCVFADHPRTGHAVRPFDEPVRYGQFPSLTFPRAEIDSFTEDKEGGFSRMLVRFFGLFGTNGALPIALTEFAYERNYLHHDTTFTHFVDIFHHRLLTLFYRAWASCQPTVQLDRPDEDQIAIYLGSLIGIGVNELRDRDAMPDHAKLHAAGHLSCQTRHPDGLAAIISSFFGVATRIEEFVGRWIQLPPECQLRLGQTRATGTLSDNALLGARLWDRQQNFRVELGPMGWEQYRRLLPGGLSLKRLAAIIRNYQGFELRWDARLVLKRAEVPRLSLGRQGQLGWSCWLLSRPSQRDAADLVLSRATETI